ncbi:uncharacterized protein LOC118754777 [Rhagoletis pomonella]|uniref:uncharacterized protein LOC118754777 n=1 Tax=Rhagoletis pomonella TaxID=28610 RepID=UPI0017822FD1|nr:uncharacterized protein LOC118754777 [Rhagoletis pomonella]
MRIRGTSVSLPTRGRDRPKCRFGLTDRNGRREWLRLLGVTGSTAKFIFACQRHFSHKVRGGRILYRWAVPDINLRVCSPPVTVDRENYLGSIIEADILVDRNTQESVIELGVEDFQPVLASPKEAERASTSNIVEDSLEESLPPASHDEA